MQTSKVGCLRAGLVALALGVCSTPGGATGRLCAPIEANTSAAAPAATAKPVRIALMLPLHSEALRAPAEAVRAGFMAAYEREKQGFTICVVETGDSTQEALDNYAAAVAENDMVVGPLARPAVRAVATSPLLGKPTIALNNLGANDIALPQHMLIMGLSMEDEASQVARWAHTEKPGATALIISGTSAWQRRIAGAFAAQWKQLGHEAQLLELATIGGWLDEPALAQLKIRLDTDAPGLLFTALEGTQVRQLRATLGGTLQVYGTSSVNPGEQAFAELDGMRMLDLPWEVQPDHPAVMAYPRSAGDKASMDLDRLYALGIDAYRVAREIALHPASSFKMDGVTGKLSVSFGQGASRFERLEAPAVYKAGAFQLVTVGQ